MTTPVPLNHSLSLLLGPSAGVGATINVKGTDCLGQITLQTGALPTLNELICNLTFVNTLLFNNFSISLTPGNYFAAMSLSSVYCYGITSGSFSLMNAGVPLLPNTTYHWYYTFIKQN